jgi:hypothetical protein
MTRAPILELRRAQLAAAGAAEASQLALFTKPNPSIRLRCRATNRYRDRRCELLFARG